jgi:hypothetical protein
MSRRNLLLLGLGVGAAAVVSVVETESHTAELSSDPAYVESLKSSPNQFVEALGDLDASSGDLNMFSGVMQFFDVSPDNVPEQTESLKQIVAKDLLPTSILDTNGLNLSDPGKDKPVIEKYFKTLTSKLAEKNVQTSDLGPFVLCPEFVVGFGGKPEHYAPYLNLFLEEAQALAPGLQTSNMIDLEEAKVLLPTLKNVNQQLLDSVGIQAFADGLVIPFHRGKADVSEFLTAKKVKPVIKALGNKPMWLNTGIIREDATAGPNGTKYSVDQRLSIANGIADVVTDLKSSGVSVDSVNIFAENKLNGRYPSLNDEKRDFSFHPGDEVILTTFAKRMEAIGVKLSGYAVPHDTLK